MKYFDRNRNENEDKSKDAYMDEKLKMGVRFDARQDYINI